MRRTVLIAVLALAIGGMPATAAAAKPPLAPTPPMGWNSWNRFGCDIDENLIRQTADAMVSAGIAPAAPSGGSPDTAP